MTLIELEIDARAIIAKRPDLRSQILDLVQLAKDEVEQDGSESHECELAMNDINDLL